MLQRIIVADEATFDSAPQEMGPLSQFNYVYGANGTGKTTISKIIADCNQFKNCTLVWQNGTPLDVFVYNRHFVDANFHECDELPGIFTLGEEDSDTVQKIARAKEEYDALHDDLERLTHTLHGPDGSGGKESELRSVEESFRDACWAQKQKHDAVFKPAFEPFRASQERFKAGVLEECDRNSSALYDLHDLQNRAATIYANNPEVAAPLKTLAHGRMPELESHPILATRVIGKSDIDIASLINTLENSDWVKAGQAFLSRANGRCPFCQQNAPELLATSLNSYFDDAFERGLATIRDVAVAYKAEVDRIDKHLNEITAAVGRFVDVQSIQKERNLFNARGSLNIEHLARKMKEPSQIIELKSVSGVLSEVDPKNWTT